MSNEDAKITLTDTEWMDLIDGDRDGLPRCCANISALRDTLIQTARDGGRVAFFNSLRQHLSWCFPDHDVPSVTMQKVIDQLGIDLAAEHEKNKVEP